MLVLILMSLESVDFFVHGLVLPCAYAYVASEARLKLHKHRRHVAQLSGPTVHSLTVAKINIL